MCDDKLSDVRLAAIETIVQILGLLDDNTCKQIGIPIGKKKSEKGKKKIQSLLLPPPPPPTTKPVASSRSSSKLARGKMETALFF